MKCLDGPMEGRELIEWWEIESNPFVSYPDFDFEGYAVEHHYRKDVDGLRFIITAKAMYVGADGIEVEPYPIAEVDRRYPV